MKRSELPLVGARVVTGRARGDSGKLHARLANELTGEIRFDRLTRALYSTDASIYQIMPLGVVIAGKAAITPSSAGSELAAEDPPAGTGGEPMSNEALERLNEALWAGKPSLKPDVPIAELRVALAKGQLAIHTHPGRGTRIDVRVPLASAPHESVAGPKSARVRRFEEAV